MKIKIITCHDVYNVGASLQAYALQTYLEVSGHEVEIINYKPDYLSRHYEWRIVANPIYNRPIIKQLYLGAKFLMYKLSLKRKRLFDDFSTIYLNRTSRLYRSNDELKQNCPLADLYIAGSDQIWNTFFRTGKDPAFYLDFVPDNKRKVSYAASLATSIMYDGYEDFIRSHIEHLDFVSVRERTSLSLLSSLGISNVVAVCDPVFLLPDSFWYRLAEKGEVKIPNHYVLVYDFGEDNEVVVYAKKVAKLLRIYP